MDVLQCTECLATKQSTPAIPKQLVLQALDHIQDIDLRDDDDQLREVKTVTILLFLMHRLFSFEQRVICRAGLTWTLISLHLH